MEVVQIIVAGIAKGSVYGLLALGFVLIYKATEQVNFAQGDIMMFGTFFSFTFITGWTGPVEWWQLPAAAVLGAVSAFLFLKLQRQKIPVALQKAKESQGSETTWRAVSALNLTVVIILGIAAGALFIRFLGGFGMPWFLGLIMGVICAAGLGYALDAVIIRRIIGQPQFAVVILTIAMGFAMRWMATMIWGADPVAFETPYGNDIWRLADEGTEMVDGEEQRVAGLVLQLKDLVIIGGAALMITSLYLFFRYTRVGIAMQAASQNQLAAYYMGIPVKYIFSLIWAISAAVACVAGVLLVPKLTVFSPEMGFLAIPAFAAAVIGGFGDLRGAVVGGLIVGLTEQLSGWLLQQLESVTWFAEVFGTGLSGSIPQISGFILMLILLVIRPQGLFAQIQRKKV